VISSTETNRQDTEQAFSLGEANVALEGFDPQQHPLYAMLKAKVLDGKMTAAEMGDSLIEYARRERAKSSAA